MLITLLSDMKLTFSLISLMLFITIIQFCIRFYLIALNSKNFNYIIEEQQIVQCVEKLDFYLLDIAIKFFQNCLMLGKQSISIGVIYNQVMQVIQSKIEGLLFEYS